MTIHTAGQIFWGHYDVEACCFIYDEYKKLCSCPFINESKNLSHKMESKGFFDSNHTFSDITKILNPEWADYPQRIRHTSLISECIRT